MFFYASKLLSYLINPLAWIIILLFITVIVRKPVKKKRYALSSLMLFLLFTNPFIGDELLRGWERPMLKTDNVVYKAGIILGGDIVSYDKQADRVIFRTGADRLLQAVHLYKTGVIEKIIISGGSGHLVYRDRTEAFFVRKYLLGIGIDKEDILIENMSRNTIENARYTGKLLEKNEITGSVLLITSSLHMRRAAACFRKQGIPVVEYPTSKITGNRLTNLDHLLIPSITTLKNWDLLIHEVIGFIIYKTLGYC